MKRLFTAVKVHPNDRFYEVFEALKQGCRQDRITWVDPANIHITLKFFGETEEERIPAISALFSEITSEFSPFEMHLRGTGIFGSSYQPRVVWIGIDENPTFTRLGQEIIDRVEALGFKKDRQNFVPHLTLGRIKRIDNKKRFFELIGKYRETVISSETVRKVHLIESKLTTGGPRYSILESFRLKSEEHLNI